MQTEIIAAGSELLLGPIVDTNSAFIVREFWAAEDSGSAQERTKGLAGAVRTGSGADIGLATVFEDVRDTNPPVTVLGVGVALKRGRAGREHRLRGDRPSLRIRGATLALDLLRRSLP